MGRTAFHDPRHRTRTSRHQALGRQLPYDVAIESHGRFLRVQVKCTRFRRGRSYKCHLDSNGHPYTPDQIDFIAAYVIPTDAWYILPIKATNAQPDVLLTPNNPRSKYEKYREAWHLLV
ncbi:MAG TPA: group I intron-associated PD-(D/E)XK endonuclease [Candidatus Sulfotelmatobacter sp.]|nr:group I intron-associated PD-(D/E)XK endonuclease [Candidatus Sulfotelmatobacter sp.]